ncbi:hypothetical protein M758_10G131700 [Ceratodon purpureus]|nr:hypothetical protein M758_10G131700 [Ceratodon purpureus]
MKKSRSFSLSRTLQRVRLGVTLSPKKWWPLSARRCGVQLSHEEAAAADDDAALLEDSAKLDHVGSSLSLSLIRKDGLHIPRSSPLPPSRPASMVTLKLLFGSPLTVLSRFKQSCGTLRETAKRSGLNASDLFVGNQLFMHFSAMPVTRRRKIQAKPSKGFGGAGACSGD